jgi:hypothetical protein
VIRTSLAFKNRDCCNVTKKSLTSANVRANPPISIAPAWLGCGCPAGGGVMLPQYV